MTRPARRRVQLATAPTGEVQAARLAQTVWGVQWHPEVDEPLLRTWCDDIDPARGRARAGRDGGRRRRARGVVATAGRAVRRAGRRPPNLGLGGSPLGGNHGENRRVRRGGAEFFRGSRLRRGDLERAAKALARGGRRAEPVEAEQRGADHGRGAHHDGGRRRGRCSREQPVDLVHEQGDARP